MRGAGFVTAQSRNVVSVRERNGVLLRVLRVWN